MNQPLIIDITNTAATRASNSKKPQFQTVDVLNGSLYLMGEANLDAQKTIIHKTGFLGGFGVISGSVKNKGGVLSVGYEQDARINAGEGGDALFVPAMSDAANDARAGADAARQPDADKGEAVPAAPLAASLPEIDAWRPAASPSDDKTGAMPPFHRGVPSPMGAGNGNSFPSLTDAGNANECPSRASDDSGYLTLVNDDDDAGVLCHPVSDGRNSGSFSPAEDDNGGELRRLNEDAGSNLTLVANTNDNLSDNLMANQAEGDNGGVNNPEFIRE